MISRNLTPGLLLLLLTGFGCGPASNVQPGASEEAKQDAQEMQQQVMKEQMQKAQQRQQQGGPRRPGR